MRKKKNKLSNKAQSLADATKLEKITTRIYQMLSPHSVVTHNDKINCISHDLI